MVVSAATTIMAAIPVVVADFAETADGAQVKALAAEAVLVAPEEQREPPMLYKEVLLEEAAAFSQRAVTAVTAVCHVRVQLRAPEVAGAYRMEVRRRTGGMVALAVTAW